MENRQATQAALNELNEPNEQINSDNKNLHINLKNNIKIAENANISVSQNIKAESKEFSFYYGDFKALKNINLPIYEKKVTALIGPSGCGKSTLLRSFNRMHDLYEGNKYEGEILLYPDNTNILNEKVDAIQVR